MHVSYVKSQHNDDTITLKRSVDRSRGFVDDRSVNQWPVWLNGRAFARDPKGRGLESRPVRFQLTALGKLLTRMCLCHQAV